MSHIACPSEAGRGTVAAEPVEQGSDRDEVGERANAVDLDHGQVFAVGGLERGVATDVDDLQVEGVPAARLGDDLERAFTEVAARRVVDGDAFAAALPRRRLGRRRQG